MKALYRKYRPTKLSDIVGQEQVTKPLEESIKSGKISHAYLFAGPRGCGKTSVARIFAHEINDFPYEVEDSYVDIIEIDAASNTGVDNIRELREKAVISPTKGKYKVYIIDEVHMLSKSASNALLKTLEEPPKNVVFIMATTDMHKILDTIISRAQVYRFNLASSDIMQKYLSEVAKKEKIKIDNTAISVIAKKGGGSFRDSISLLDQVSTISTDKITEQTVIQALGLPENEEVDSLLTAYQEGDVTKITDLLHQFLNSSKKPEQLAESLVSAIIEHPEPKLLPLLERLPEVRAPFPEAKILLAFLADAAEKPVLHISTPAATSPDVEPVHAPTPSAAPSEAPASSKKPATSFDWNSYLEKLQTKNASVAHFLRESAVEYEGQKIVVYIEKRFHRNLVESEKNRKMINALLPEGMALETRNASEHAAKIKDFDKISDIMGKVTEVKPDGDPFE